MMAHQRMFHLDKSATKLALEAQQELHLAKVAVILKEKQLPIDQRKISLEAGH